MSDKSADDVLREFFERLERFNTSRSSFPSGGGAGGESVDFEGLNKGFDNLGASTSKLRGAQANLSQDMRYSSRILKDTFVGHIFGSSKALGKLEEGLKKSSDSVEQLEREVKSAGEAVEKLEAANTKLGAAATAEDKARLAAARRRLETARSEHDAADETHKGLTSRFGRMSSVLDGVSKTMSQGASLIGKAVDGFMSITDNLLKGENAIAFATGTLQTSVSLVAESLKLVGTAAGALGNVLDHTPAKFAANITKFAAYLANATAEQADRINKGLQMLGDELQKTVNSYHTLSTVGATFAGGMEEMRKLSQSAAMGLSEFTKIVQTNADTFAQAGLGMTSAAKRFASISKSMSESGLREQITNLGYSFEEMGGLTADVMAQLKSTGQLGYKSDQEIGQLTADYAKNLRLISDITGQDARKKMEAARNESLKAGVFEKVMRQGGPEAVAKLQQQLASMPDVMKKGYLEFVASGGTAIRDMGMNIGMQQNKEIMPYLQQQYGDLNDRSVDLNAATERTLRGAARVGQGAQQVTQLGEALGTAQVFGATGEGVTAGAEFGSGLRQQTQKYASPEEVDAAIERARQAQKDPGKLTKEVSKTTEEFQRAKSQVEGLADKALPGFASMLGVVTTSVKDFGAALGEVTKALGGEVIEEKKPEGPGVFSRMKSWFSGSDDDKKANEKTTAQDQNTKKQEAKAQDQNTKKQETTTQEQNVKKQEKPVEPENKRSIFDGIKSVFQDQTAKKQEKPVEPSPTTVAVNPNEKRELQGQEKIAALESQRKRLEEKGPRTSTEQSKQSHQEMLKTLDTAIAAEKAKANTSSTTRETKSEIRIAGEPVIPGQLLSDRQMAVMKMSMDSGNNYPPDIMAQYKQQVGSMGTNPTENSTGIDMSGKPKKALGGITSGISIAGERGPEAVVPLPNGRSIPVDIQSTGVNYEGVNRSSGDPIAQMMNSLEAFFKNQVSTMQKDSDTMDSILRVLQDSYSTQDKLLANSF
jgi:hypothetical protein